MRHGLMLIYASSRKFIISHYESVMHSIRNGGPKIYNSVLFSVSLTHY